MHSGLKPLGSRTAISFRDHQGVRPHKTAHGPAHGLFDAPAFQALAHDNVGNDLGIRGGVEDGPPLLQGCAQFVGIDQIAVVAQGQAPLVMVDEDGLHVPLIVGPGGGIPHMPDGDVPLSQLLQPLWREYLADKPRLPAGGEAPLVVYNYARALLPPVLKSKQAAVAQGRKVGLFGGVGAEDAAFFM